MIIRIIAIIIRIRIIIVVAVAKKQFAISPVRPIIINIIISSHTPAFTGSAQFSARCELSLA